LLFLLHNTTMQNQEIFIARLKKLMDENNDNSTSLANKISATPAAVSLWLLGERVPKMKYFQRLAKCYEVSIDYLAGIEDY